MKLFFQWYDAQCRRPFVGIAMVPLTILALFAPLFLAVFLSKLSK